MARCWACFLLGLLTKRVQQTSAMIAMIAGLAADDLRPLRDSHRFHLVRCHRDRRDIFDRLRVSLFLKEPRMMNLPLAATIRHGLKRELGVWSAAAIVVGTVIGSGIFLVPSTMARNVGSPLKIFVVWIAGGLLSLFGALSYAELAAAMPEAGGEYVYLREAYGPLWGFPLWLDADCGLQKAAPSPR